MDDEDEEQTYYRRHKVSKTAVASGNLWEATLRFRYKLQPDLLTDKRETFWTNLSLKASLGPGWRVTYTSRFDMELQQLVSHQLQLYREIHCWELAFSWWPSGGGKGFMFNINVKDPDLKDIKYEADGGRQSLTGF